MTAIVTLDAELDPDEPVNDHQGGRRQAARLALPPAGRHHAHARTSCCTSRSWLRKTAPPLRSPAPTGRKGLVRAGDEPESATARHVGTRFEDGTGLSGRNVSTARIWRSSCKPATPTPRSATIHLDFVPGQDRAPRDALRNTNNLTRSSRWTSVVQDRVHREAGRCLVMQVTLAERSISSCPGLLGQVHYVVGDATRYVKWLEFAPAGPVHARHPRPWRRTGDFVSIHARNAWPARFRPRHEPPALAPAPGPGGGPLLQLFFHARRGSRRMCSRPRPSPEEHSAEVISTTSRAAAFSKRSASCPSTNLTRTEMGHPPQQHRGKSRNSSGPRPS